MTKEQLIESVRGIVLTKEPTADSNGKLHYKRVEQAVNQAFSTLMQGMNQDKRKSNVDFDRTRLEDYAKTYYSQPVMRGSRYDYTEIEDKFVSLKNGSGLCWVKPSGASETYGREPYNHIGIYASHPVFGLIDETFVRIGNVPETDEFCIIYDHSAVSSKRHVELVDYAIVRSLEAYEDDEEISIPNEDYLSLVATATQLLGQRYTDTQNNDE